MVAILTNKKEKKVDVEQLRENFLSGPAEEADEVREKELMVDAIVPVKEVPHMERIIFRNQRDPGQPLEFHYSSKTCPFKMYKLIDGKEETLPLEVIRNLEGCRENVEKYRKNSEGVPEIYVAGYKTHFVCERTK